MKHISNLDKKIVIKLIIIENNFLTIIELMTTQVRLF